MNQSSSGVSQRSRRSYTSLHALGRALGEMSCSTASWMARAPQIVCKCSLRSSGAGWKGRASNDATTSDGESSRPWGLPAAAAPSLGLALTLLVTAFPIFDRRAPHDPTNAMLGPFVDATPSTHRSATSRGRSRARRRRLLAERYEEEGG